MADISYIRLSFEREEDAIRALRAAEVLIKLVYAPADLPWIEEARKLSLAEQYFKYAALALALDPLKDNPYCCIQRLHPEGNDLLLDRCSDISRSINFGFKNNFFSQLCFTCAALSPSARFSAFASYEMTVSDVVEHTFVEYDGSVMHMLQKGGEEMYDEDDWKWSYSEDFAAKDGVFVSVGHNG